MRLERGNSGVMDKEKYQSLRALGKAGENGGLSQKNTFWWLTVYWFLFGQILMLLLDHINVPIAGYIDRLVIFSEFIPSVASIHEAKVFDGQLAIRHYAIMWLMSFGFCVICFVAPIAKSEEICFMKAKQPIVLALIYIGIAVFNMLTDFYTGFYSFGLANFKFGFAVISSFSTLILPYAIRFSFLAIKKGF